MVQNNLKTVLLFLFFTLTIFPQTKEVHIAVKSEVPPIIDGIPDDACWMNAGKYPIDKLWIGAEADSVDFQGQFSLSWDENFLYILAEINDDSLLDKQQHPLIKYWDDDCLEIFIDEDNSGGNHRDNYNAFAYHIAIDGRVVDVGTNGRPRELKGHLVSAIKSDAGKHIWEVAIKIFGEDYDEDSDSNTPLKLSAEKRMGFMIAYCDNDTSPERESFYGSVIIEGNDKNIGWIDANIFGLLKLKDSAAK